MCISFAFIQTLDDSRQGRTLAGGVGLFPVSYTAPAPSTTGTSHALPSPEPVSGSHSIPTSNGKFVLQPLTEESESEASGVNILSPLPKNSTNPLLNSDDHTELPREGDAFHNLASGDNEIMKATMTDVQKAIGQLGRDVGDDGDGARSFSFASTKDGENNDNSDTDVDLSDFVGAGINGNGGEDWRKAASRRIVAKAKRAVEEAEKLKSMMGVNENGRRAAAPPIEVDFSDESEVEDDADLTRSSKFRHDHSPIPDKDENENVGTNGETTSAADGTRYSITRDVFVPPNDETDVPTATKLSFSAPQTPVPTEPLPEKSEEKTPKEKDIYSSFMVGHIGSSNALQVQEQPNSISVFTGSASIPVSTTVQGRNETSPMEWSIKEVVDWLKSKGFDQNVCDKFNGEHNPFPLNTKKQ